MSSDGRVDIGAVLPEEVLEAPRVLVVFLVANRRIIEGAG
jgi:hypothetical protein